MPQPPGAHTSTRSPRNGHPNPVTEANGSCEDAMHAFIRSALLSYSLTIMLSRRPPFTTVMEMKTRPLHVTCTSSGRMLSADARYASSKDVFPSAISRCAITHAQRAGAAREHMNTCVGSYPKTFAPRAANL
jgi:hypothetical protein